MATTALRSMKIASSLTRVCRNVIPRLAVVSAVHSNNIKEYHTCQRSSDNLLRKVQ